jgi:hypothetical protein
MYLIVSTDDGGRRRITSVIVSRAVIWAFMENSSSDS